MGWLKKIAFLSGQVGLMMLARYFFQWIIRFSSEPIQEGEASAALTDAAEVRAVAEFSSAIERICGVADGETVLTALFPIAILSSVLLAFRVFDGVTDPVAGALSDWWVRRGRERRSLLWFSFWIAPAGLILCFSPSAAHSLTLRWILMGSGLVVFFVGYTLYCIPYWSLVSDYSQGDENRQRVLSTLLGAGLLLATGIGFVASPLLIEALGYQESALTFALISLPLLLLPYFAAPVSTPTDSLAEREDGETVGAITALRAALQNRPFFGLICLLAGSQMSLTMMTTAAPFIAEGLLNATKGEVALLMGPFLASALLSFPLVPWLSRRFGWSRSMVGAAVGLAAVYALTGTLGTALIGSPMVTAALTFTLAGPFVAVLLGMEGEAIGDCATAGGGQVSMYWGVFNLAIKTLNGVALWIGGLIVARVCPALPDFWGESIFGRTFWVESGAIRSMSLAAGIFLLAGVGAYLILAARSSKQ